MKILEIKKASFGWFPRQPLFAIESMSIDAGAKVLLTGKNGAGKSTLLRILSGEEPLTSGERNVNPHARIIRFEQSAFYEGTVREIFDELFLDVMRAEAAMRQMEMRLQTEWDERTLRAYGELCDCFEGLGGYGYLVERSAFLETFGLTARLDVPFAQLSGGEQQYVRLAKTVFSQCSLMLLDEPLSFLDQEKRKWLIGFLSRSPTAFVIVCHEERQIRGLTSQTLEIANGRVIQYAGDVSAAQEQKQAAESRIFRQNKDVLKIVDSKRQEIARRKQWMKTSEEKHLHAVMIRRLEREIRSLHSRMQSSLYDQEQSADIVFPFLDEHRNGGETLLALRQAGASYGQKRVLSELSFTVRMHEHVLVKGPNGSGKTTLVRLLTGQIRPDSGSLWRAPGLRIGVLRQLESDEYAACTVLQYCTAIRGMGLDSFLAGKERFWRPEEMLEEKRLHMLSGGERRKVELMILMNEPHDLLILDEPSVGLDERTADCLLQALNQFPGAVVLISHDDAYLEGFQTEKVIWTGDSPVI